jgi:hypothetical protein
MDKYVEIIKLLERIFGKSAVSKSLGTRTNVVRFPKGKQGLDPTTRHFDVEGTAQNNPDLVNTIKNSIEDRMGDITKMNDQELLTYKQNLQRFADYTNPLPLPTADVIEAGSKQRVTGEGLEKLIEEQGLVASPKTPLGSAQLNIKRAEQEMNKIIKENDLDSLLKGAGRDQLSWNRLHNEGLVRAVTRQILSEDIRAGKIKGLTLDDLGTSREPIDYFRKIYGEGALEQLDSLTPEFNRLSTEQEAAKLARSKFKFEPDETKTKGSTSYEELEKEIKKPEPEEKADGGSIGLDYLMGMDSRPKYAGGGDVKKILDLIAKANKELKGKRSMEKVNPKTGEVTVPKEPIKTAERKTIDYDAMEEANKLTLKHKEAAYAFDQIQPIDIYDKIAPDRVAEVMAEIKGKDYYGLSQKQQLELYRKAQSFLDDYIKIDRINSAVKKFNAGEELQAIDKGYLSKFLPESGVTFVPKKTQENMPVPYEQPVTKKTSNIDEDFFQNEFKQAMQEGVKKSNEMKAMGLDPSKSKDYDKFLEMESIKQKYGNVIDDNLLQQILVDDNPQRKAEVLATIDEAMKMQEKGMKPEEIINIIKNTTRTKQANGGPIGLNYLLGI